MTWGYESLALLKKNEEDIRRFERTILKTMFGPIGWLPKGKRNRVKLLTKSTPRIGDLTK